MDCKVLNIEKYFLTRKDPKDLFKNIQEMSNEELREIVTILLNQV